MRYTVTDTYEAMCKEAAQRIATVIRKKAAEGKMAVIGLATGTTPKGVYEELKQMKEKGLSFKNVITFNLDEYIPDEGDPKEFLKGRHSYHTYMHENLFQDLMKGENGIDPRNIHIPDTSKPDLDEVCRQYEKDIKEAGGIDLQLVGIGENGHLGFCEPGKSDPESRTSVVELAQHTVDVNFKSCGFSAKKAISMGLGTIAEAREILLIANGPKKSPIIKETLSNDLTRERTPEMRAELIRANPSLLLDYHENASAIVDMEAYRSLIHRIGSREGYSHLIREIDVTAVTHPSRGRR